MAIYLAGRAGAAEGAGLVSVRFGTARSVWVIVIGRSGIAGKRCFVRQVNAPHVVDFYDYDGNYVANLNNVVDFGNVLIPELRNVD